MILAMHVTKKYNPNYSKCKKKNIREKSLRRISNQTMHIVEQEGEE
jgi:hypothetical protein